MNLDVDVIFLDFYGTVSGGDARAVERTCAAVVADFGLDLTPPEFAVRWGEVFFEMMGCTNGAQFMTLRDLELASLRAALDQRNGACDLGRYVAIMGAYWADPPIFDDAVMFLRRVDRPVCCVSNADNEHLEEAIERHGLNFAGVVTSESARSYKPDPEIFRTALQRMETTPERVLHVGDSLHSDIGGARNLGIRSAWICRDDRIHDIGSAKPDHRISALTELLALI